jgi:hypothetical protein
MHNGRKIRADLAAFEGHIYQKTNVREWSYPSTTNTGMYINMGAI